MHNQSNIYMLYLKNRNRYRHVCHTEISVMPNFIFTFNTFIGHKIKAFQVIKEKQNFLDFWGRHLGIIENSRWLHLQIFLECPWL